MNKKNKSYTEEFKKTIAELNNQGKSATALASEYCIDRRLIYRWRNLYKEIAVEDGKTVTNAEYLKMQKQLKELEKENEILKKAVAIFAVD